MVAYIERFVAGYGINFENNKKNHEAFECSKVKWAEISSSLRISENERSILMFCGAKNNGKSSLARYLINEYVHSMNQNDIETTDQTLTGRYAYYIDFDPGQPEMTTPSLVSAHIIRSSEQPLISPPYLNLFNHKPIYKTCVGGLNMSVNPRSYIASCHHVFTQVLKHRRMQDKFHPIFINTMGFIRTVGLAILVDLIKMCKLTHLIVLNIEDDPLRTVCMDLSPSAIDDTRASFAMHVSSNKLKYNYQVHNLQFNFTESTSVATKNRTASQLAYFGTLHQALYKPILQCTPKYMHLKSVYIHCVASYPLKANIVLEILNMSWVHLVKLDEKSVESFHPSDCQSNEEGNESICNMVDDTSANLMLGCGIVVDLNLEEKILSIITPLDQDTLDKEVNCIVKPLSVQIPREIL